MLRLRCTRCGAFLANVRALYGPLKSVLVIEINCRNRDCKAVNEIEFQIRKPIRASKTTKRKRRRRYD